MSKFTFYQFSMILCAFSVAQYQSNICDELRKLNGHLSHHNNTTKSTHTLYRYKNTDERTY